MVCASDFTRIRYLKCCLGPVVRISFNEVSFASPEAAKQIYSVGQGFNKTEAYSVYPPPENPDIFTEADEAKHAIKRRMVSNAYSHKSILDMERFVDKTEERLFHKLDELFIEGGPKECDLGSWLEFYAFDVRLSLSLFSLLSQLSII